MDSVRAWVLRLGTFFGFVALLGAGYAAIWTTKYPCPHSTPQHGYACDPPAPDHPHLHLALLLASVAFLLFAATALVAHFWKESIWWKPPRRSRRDGG